MIMKRRYFISTIFILWSIFLLCGCTPNASTVNTTQAEVPTIATTAPSANSKKPLSGTAFVSAMEKKGYEWDGEEIYNNGKYSDDEFKVTEIRDYSLSVSDNGDTYYYAMTIRYIKCADLAGAANIFRELKSYASTISNEESGDNYTRVELNDVDGWDYGLISMVDNTIITIIADQDYQLNATQLMSDLGY